ncbi:MAG: patatin-like phospholipase family protein [Planctomycetes bacterium]|nr:patatin-like phospholipase family protein [Planctomycetota bacterium]
MAEGPGELEEHVVFGGAGLASLFGAGALHAWHVAGAEAPRHVAGVSLGALHAAALARWAELPPGERERFLRRYFGFWLEAPADAILSGLPRRHDLGLAQRDPTELDEVSAHRESWTVLLNRVLTLRLAIGSILDTSYHVLRLRRLVLQRGRFLQIYPPFVWSIFRILCQVPGLALSALMIPPRRSIAPPFSRERFSLQLGSRRLGHVVRAATHEAGTWLLAAAALLLTPFLLLLFLALELPLLCAVMGFAGRRIQRDSWRARRYVSAGLGAVLYVFGATLLGVVVVPLLPFTMGLRWMLRRLIYTETPRGKGSAGEASERLLDFLLLRIQSTSSLRESVVHPHALAEVLEELFGGDVVPASGDASGGARTRLHLIAADLERARVEILPEEELLVPRLLAAISRPPWLPAVKLRGGRFVDAGHVEATPTDLLLRALRAERGPRRRGRVFAYYGEPLRDGWEGGRARGGLPSAAQVFVHTRPLRRRKDLLLDLCLTEQANELIERTYPAGEEPQGAQRLLEIEVRALFPKSAQRLRWRKLVAGRSRRDVAARLAEGCRATLQERYAEKLRALAPEGERSLPCRVLREALGNRRAFEEICEGCSAQLDIAREPKIDPRPMALTSLGDRRLEDALPRATPESAAKLVRPLTALVLSGGVFRGVYQVGVLGALWGRGLVPRVVAGSSVGAISALVAKGVFEQMAAAGSRDGAPGLALLHTLAGVYLEVEERVVPERFAEGFQSFYRRAREVGASLHDVDQALRRYGEKSFAVTERMRSRLRQAADMVLGVTPARFDRLVELARSSHRRRGEDLPWLELVERGLELYGFDRELLGAEKLEGHLRGNLTTELLRRSEVLFLATATRLATGEELHLVPTPDWDLEHYVQAAMISAAYPGAFRVRRGTELFPHANGYDDTYTDGGILNNLPVLGALDALRASRGPARVAAADELPELVLVPTFEVPRHWSDVRKRSSRWPLLADWRAQGRLANNRKVRKLVRHQERLRTLLREARRKNVPLDAPYARILPVYPSRLRVGAFEFCFELGFDERKQVETIAHGCHSTVRQIARFADELASGYHRLEADAEGGTTIEEHYAALPPPLAERREFPCHHDPRQTCPFHPLRARAESPTALDARALREIYERCARDVVREEPRVAVLLLRGRGSSAELLLVRPERGPLAGEAWWTVPHAPQDDIESAEATARDTALALLERGAEQLSTSERLAGVMGSSESYEELYRFDVRLWRLPANAAVGAGIEARWMRPSDVLEGQRDPRDPRFLRLRPHVFALVRTAREAALLSPGIIET